jgi:hypothetical protein
MFLNSEVEGVGIWCNHQMINNGFFVHSAITLTCTDFTHTYDTHGRQPHWIKTRSGARVGGKILRLTHLATIREGVENLRRCKSLHHRVSV